MKNRRMNSLALITLFVSCFASNLKAQEQVFVGGRGNGTAKSSKTFQKVIKLVDADTQQPLKNYFITLAKNNTAFYPTNTNAEGYATIVFNMTNYYSKVELNFNDDKYMRPDWKERRNAIAYKTDNIEFKTKKEVADTTIVYVKQIK